MEEERDINGEPSPAYARRKAVLRNREMRLSLDRAETWVLAHPEATSRRWRRDDGVLVDGNEPGLLLAYEETDADTRTWIEWHDLWGRPELVE
jgi:hypothetical protein